MEKYIPDIYQKSIYTVDYSKLFSRGIKCLLFDLDNTLMPVKSKEEPLKAKELLISLKQKGFKIIIFSNSPKTRVQKYKNFFDVDAVSFACKPLSGKFKKVIKDYNLEVTEVAIIGDQLLTDVAGGNRMGITTILTNPASNKDNLIGKISRRKEKKIMKKLRDRDLFCKGRYYD